MNQTPNNQINRSHKTAEELLVSGVDTKLTASEQSEMWGNLKAYAEFHTPATAEIKKKAFFSAFHVWSGVIATLVLFLGTGVASSRSLPGDFLYPIKVDVTERTLGYLQFSDIDKLEYQGEAINTRLNELKELAKVNRLNEEEILIIEEEMTERSEEIKVILEQSDEYSVEESDSVRILSDILADLKTHKYIEDTELGTMRESKIDDIEESISGLYQDEITDFVATSPEEVNDFINNSLMSINDYVTESEFEEDIDLEVRDFLVDVSEALEVNDIQRALYYVGEAEQTIEFNEEVHSMQPSSVTE